jgi:hypothetical protein
MQRCRLGRRSACAGRSTKKVAARAALCIEDALPMLFVATENGRCQSEISCCSPARTSTPTRLGTSSRIARTKDVPQAPLYGLLGARAERSGKKDEARRRGERPTLSKKLTRDQPRLTRIVGGASQKAIPYENFHAMNAWPLASLHITPRPSGHRRPVAPAAFRTRLGNAKASRPYFSLYIHCRALRPTPLPGVNSESDLLVRSR